MFDHGHGGHANARARVSFRSFYRPTLFFHTKLGTRSQAPGGHPTPTRGGSKYPLILARESKAGERARERIVFLSLTLVRGLRRV